MLSCLAAYGADCVVMVLVWTTLAAALTVHFAAQRDVRLARLALQSAYSTLLVMIVAAVGHIVTLPSPPR
jgi:hypothetical protein